MTQETVTAIGDLSADVVARLVHNGGGWMLVGGAVLLAASIFIALALFLQADPETRRDIIDLVHGHRKSAR